MNRLQHFLNIKPFVDYSDKLKFDRKKGFFCKVAPDGGQPKCLGKGKGRLYPNMDPESWNFLRDYYRLYNEALLKLLNRLGYSIPDWLEDELKDTRVASWTLWLEVLKLVSRAHKHEKWPKPIQTVTADLISKSYVL